MLYVVSSLVYLKLKYHNLQGDSTTNNVNLNEEKIINQALQKDKGDGIIMELNVTSLIRQLNMMDINPLRSG